MAFTQNWFEVTGAALWWAHVVPRLGGKEWLLALEIGSHEGGSAVWMCQHLLTGVSSRLICVDPFTGSMEHRPSGDSLRERFDANTAAFRDRITVHATTSFRYLTGLHTERGSEPLFDLVYVDGSHIAQDVLTDALLAWPLLNLGGIMVFDDYSWDTYEERELMPKLGADCFHGVCGHEMNVLAVGPQVLVEKVPSRLTHRMRGM